MTRTNGREADWPDTSRVAPPAGGCYQAAVWLLGRHPDLARLAARIHGVITHHDDAPDNDGPDNDGLDVELEIDLEHLADVVGAVGSYHAAWAAYERRHRPPSPDAGDYDAAYDAWQGAGPKADDIVIGLHDFLVMSSGEVARIRLLATLASQRAPFSINDLRSLDASGQRLLADWTEALRAGYGSTAWHHHSTTCSLGQEPGVGVDTVPSL